MHLELNRPGQKNALSLDLMKQLTEEFKRIAQDKTVRAVVLTGQGSVFCAGADLQEMQDSVNKSHEQNLADAHILYDLFESAWNLPQPLLTRLQGAAMGGALGLVAVSDWVVAEPDVKFCFSEVRLGLAPAVISEFILRKVNIAQVQDLMLLAPVFNAQLALGRSLIQQISDGDQSLKELEQKISEVIQLSPLGVISTKSLLRAYVEKQSSHRDLVTQLIAQLRISPEGQEGVKAFFEKRSPSWVYKKGEI